MNLYLEATVRVTSFRGNTTIKERYDLYQTPTKITNEAIRSNNPLGVYFDWLPTVFDNYQTSCAKNDLLKWLEERKEWDIEWYEM